MKVKSLIKYMFEIEYEDQNDNIKDTERNIRMSTIDELLKFETKDSVPYTTIIQSVKQK